MRNMMSHARGVADRLSTATFPQPSAVAGAGEDGSRGRGPIGRAGPELGGRGRALAKWPGRIEMPLNLAANLARRNV